MAQKSALMYLACSGQAQSSDGKRNGVSVDTMGSAVFE